MGKMGEKVSVIIQLFPTPNHLWFNLAVLDSLLGHANITVMISMETISVKIFLETAMACFKHWNLIIYLKWPGNVYFQLPALFKNYDPNF